MKKSSVLPLLLALLILFPLFACADSMRDFLTGLSDGEILLLQQYLNEEMASRGLDPAQEDAIHATISAAQPLVWIPKSGSKYHGSSTCSNMKNPSQVSLDVAKELGFTPCKRCGPPK